MLLRKGGCRSVHIGGGEPFLNFKGLLMMIRALNNAGIDIEYIETNAYWITGDSSPQKSEEKLKCLLKEGCDTLCISIDPYHAEHIPYGAPLALTELCDKTGMGYFLWKQEFLSALSWLDPLKIHSRLDLEKAISRDYINTTARFYGIGYGGRAVNIEREFNKLLPAVNLANDNSPCQNLLSTGHFHVDMDCFFIPPRCTGIRIPFSEALDGIPKGKYPVFEALYYGGVSALLELALQHGFTPESYPSKCSFCFYLRSFLCDKGFAELDEKHYEEALKYY